MDKYTLANVSFFHEEKKYGFATCSEYERIFFHTSRGLTVEYPNNNDEAKASGLILPRFSKKHWAYVDLVKDQLIYVIVDENDKGYYAKNWFIKAEYDRIVANIRSGLTYRFLIKDGTQKTSRLEPYGYLNDKAVELWKGDNLCELSTNFPRIHYPVVTNENRRVWFEVLINDEWTQCQDPRSI